MKTRTAARLSLVASLGLLAGCGGSRDGAGGAPRSQVVVYSAQDREFAEPILKAYEKQAGVAGPAKFDVESTKTVGLANTIIAEKSRPRCDLFWNNEILNTLRLKEQGLARPVPAVARRRSARDLQGQGRHLVRVRRPGPRSSS